MAACQSEPSPDVAGSSVEVGVTADEPDEPFDPAYDPSYDWVRDEPAPTETKTGEVLAAEASQREALRRAENSVAAWVTKVRSRLPSDFSIVVGRFVSNLGGRLGGALNAMEISVESQVTGTPLDGTITVTQFAFEGHPMSCGSLHGVVGARYVLIVSPEIAVSGAFRLLMDFDSGLTGWGREQASGAYAIELGPSEHVTTADLGTLVGVAAEGQP